jgi:hypothetical protein
MAFALVLAFVAGCKESNNTYYRYSGWGTRVGDEVGPMTMSRCEEIKRIQSQRDGEQWCSKVPR